MCCEEEYEQPSSAREYELGKLSAASGRGSRTERETAGLTSLWMAETPLISLLRSNSALEYHVLASFQPRRKKKTFNLHSYNIELPLCC